MTILHMITSILSVFPLERNHNKGVHKFPDLQQSEVYDHVFQKSKSVLTIATAEV